MAIQNLPEGFYPCLLPDSLVENDERGLLSAVLAGIGDRLDDLRTFADNIGNFWVPGALPQAQNNAILVDLFDSNGKAYTRTLNIDSTTPSTNPALTLWAAQQLNLDLSTVANVRYGVDLLRFVDADTLSLLGLTIGAVLYPSLAVPDNSQMVKLVQTWFPRLKLKGTAQSFDVLGRILGFDDVRVTPLWTRLSPRNPDDIGDPQNAPDFSANTQFVPAQILSPLYDPFEYRDGAFFSWSTVVTSGTADTSFYETAVNGFNPWVEVILLGSLVGTNLPSVINGSVVHPASGSYALGNGAFNLSAYVDPPGSSMRFQALAQGDNFNGLEISVLNTGSNVAYVSINDRLSGIKYRSSYFDIGLTMDMDKLEEIFGSRAASTNKDLQANPELTSDGTAVSPFRPWVSGSFYGSAVSHDWVSVVVSSVPAQVRIQADPTVTRQLNMDLVTRAGVQVTQAFEEVRAATRQVRDSRTGFLLKDQLQYAAYDPIEVLFTVGIGVSYSGVYLPVPSSTAQFSFGAAPMHGEVSVSNSNLAVFVDVTGSVHGTYHFDTGSYLWTVPALIFQGSQVVGTWAPVTTELIRAEPSFADKATGTVAYQVRPEDQEDAVIDEVADDFPYLREVTAGGELVEITSYAPDGDLEVVPLAEVTAFLDHTGVENDVFAALSAVTSIPRMVSEARATDDTYQPGYRAVGYQGTFRNLTQLTSAQIRLTNVPNDYDTLFLPGYGLYHVGLAQGVLVADLPKFFGSQHRHGLALWLPFNEHPDDNLSVIDHSVTGAAVTLNGLVWNNRVWSAERGWALTIAPGASLTAQSSLNLGQSTVISCWLSVLNAPAQERTIIAQGAFSISLKPDGSLTGYVAQGGTPVLIGNSGAIGDPGWRFVYLRVNAGAGAVFGFGSLATSAAETVVSGVFDAASDATSTLSVAAQGLSFGIHDLRIWNSPKNQAQLDLVRYHQPKTTICPYRLGFISTLDRLDRYGLRVLSNGWVTPDALPAWYRRAQQAMIVRYDSMGSYHGEPRFKEVGLGGGAPPPGSYTLGQQFITMVASGTAPFSTGDGQLPGTDVLWINDAAPGTYATLPFSGSTANGITPVYKITGTSSPWPNRQVQTNPFREAIWVNNSVDGLVYEMTLDANATSIYPVLRQLGKPRALAELQVDPFLGPLLSTGTVYGQLADGQAVSGTIIGASGTYGMVGFPTKVFSVNDLYTSEIRTGPFVAKVSTATGSLVYTGTATGTVFMYLNSEINVQVANAYQTWTDAGAATTLSNGVSWVGNPGIVELTGSGNFLRLPVLGQNGLLEFQNTSNLPAGNYELTVVSGQIGQPDIDLTGFDVTLTLNSTVLQKRLLSGPVGYNAKGTDVFDLVVADGVSGNWLLTFDWESALADAKRGTQRQFAVFGYTLRRLRAEACQVVLQSNLAPIITQLQNTGAYTGTLPGGWLAAINSYGSAAGSQQESNIYPGNDTVISVSALSNTLTGSTNDRREDIIYTGSNVVLRDTGSFVYPTFGSVGLPYSALHQEGESGSFYLWPPVVSSGSAVYAYVWNWWDNTVTTTVIPSAIKTINSGGHPFYGSLNYSCTPVAVDGQSQVYTGTFNANNAPQLLPQAFITNNDAYFSYSSRLGLAAFDYESDALTFAWYLGNAYLGAGTNAYLGSVVGTWSGNGVTVVGNFAGTANYLNTLVTAPEAVVCYVSDNRGGTSAIEFDLRGQIAPPPSLSVGGGGNNLQVNTTGLTQQRVGVGQTAQWTAYAQAPSNALLSFLWTFAGSNGWSMPPLYQTGTTTVLPDGSSQNTVLRDISSEVVSGASKISTVVLDVTSTDLGTGAQQVSETQSVIELLPALPPAVPTIVRLVGGNPISGVGPVTLGSVIEFDASAVDPANETVTFEWVIQQPFVPTTETYWGPKIVYSTANYSHGQSVTGFVTCVNRLGLTSIVIIPVTNIS